MANKLRAQDVAALQRALESQRYAARSAQERSKDLQQALDSERSAVRALKRESAAQERAIREEEGKKYSALTEQLKNRLELAKSEAVAAEREHTTRTLTAQFQREIHAREEEWRRETKRQLELLQEQVKEAQQRELEAVPIQSQTDALVHSLHADFHRNLRQKQEEWRRETNAQVEALTNQLRELQRLYTDTCNKLTTITNEAETVPKLRQEIHTLKLQNKELEEKIQVLTDAERRKVEEFRSLHEESSMRIAELQRAARKEAFQLLEEMKSKDRVISQLQREYHQLAARQRSRSPGLSPLGRSRLSSETSARAGEPMRNCLRKPKTLSFASDWNKRLRAQEGRKPPDPPEAEVDTTKKEDDLKNEDVSCPSSLEAFMAEPYGGFDTADMIGNWTKKVGVDTLYQLLLEEHQELQMTHHNTMVRLREEERIRTQLEDQLKGRRSNGEGDNAINIALAEQIQVLQERQLELEAEAQELREQNDLLEFRILELDDGGCAHSCSSFQFKSPPSRSPDTRDREIDDVSDSGVMSLPTSEDISEADFQDFKMEPNNRDVKSKLSQLCQSLDNVSERISVQQALALLRHYESRLENLEATLAAMCQEATQTKTYDPIPAINGDHAKSPSRIIATVLPFTDLSPTYQGREVRDDIPLKRVVREQDCMQESGIFEEGGLVGCLLHTGTQTDWTFDPPPGDLGAEIRKLTQIRERIEEKGGNKKLLKTSEADSEFLTEASFKDLMFYRERAQILEDKLAIYESKGDEQAKLLAMRLEKEVLLAAQVKHLQNAVRHLKEENRFLEEEKCEFEEAENDTRLRCQKLEVKLSALGEKKSHLQVQLQQNARTMSNLRSTLSEEERKRNEARKYAEKMEALVNKFEQQNFEMEEKEMEIRYRLHTLENVVPAMVMYYLWRMLNALRPYKGKGNRSLAVYSSFSDSSLVTSSSVSIRRDLHRKFSKFRQTYDKPQSTTLSSSAGDTEQFLNTKQNDSQVSSDVSFVLIEELAERCHALEERIKELELKEKLYQETLQNGDEIFSTMELDYKTQIKNLEEELIQKQIEVKKAESQLRKCLNKNDHESQLQDRINQLETELSKLQETLAQRDKEKKMLEGEKVRLTKELEEALNNLEKFKKTVEKPLSEEVEQQKLKVKELLGDLDKLEQEKYEDDEQHRRLVKELKKVNDLACRQLEENEVTISELREEVQTLEGEVSDLRKTLRDERDQSERQLIRVGAELEAKEQEIRNLNGAHSPAESLHEELLQADLDSPIVAAELPVDLRSTSDISASKKSTKSPHRQTMSECQRAELVIKDYESNQFLNSTDQLISAYQHSRTCNLCKSTVAVELRRILSIVQNTAPQSMMNQALPDQPIQLPFDNLLYVTGANQPSSSIAVTKGLEREWKVSGKPAGALSLSPLSPQSLLVKCRVKDHMIRCLADQLRALQWHAPDLLVNLSQDPPYTFDFNRTTLLEYLNDFSRPDMTGLIEDVFDPGYSNRNPLILKVLMKCDSASLLVAWNKPSSNFVTGFQIAVEGQISQKIFSGARTSAVLHPVDMTRPVTLTISALQRNNQVIQEHSITYPLK